MLLSMQVHAHFEQIHPWCAIIHVQGPTVLPVFGARRLGAHDRVQFQKEAAPTWVTTAEREALGPDFYVMMQSVHQA